MTKLCCQRLRKLSTKRCRFVSCSSLKDTISNCHTWKCSRSVSSYEDEIPSISYFNDELEVVSVVRARARVAKLRRKSILWDESFSSVFYPVTLSELFLRSARQHDNKEDSKRNGKIQDENKNEESEEFLSVMSHFSRDGSVASEYFSVKTSFSECSSSKEEEDLFSELKRRSIIQEFSYCKGWPFGLCRRVILLPPLPKSPSDSWSWCDKQAKVMTH